MNFKRGDIVKAGINLYLILYKSQGYYNMIDISSSYFGDAQTKYEEDVIHLACKIHTSIFREENEF